MFQGNLHMLKRRKRGRIYYATEFVEDGGLMSYAPQGLSKVAIAHPGQSIAHIGLYIAQQRGFFRDEGLDAQLVRLPSTPAIKALTAGEVQAVTTVASVIRAIERGNVPLKVVSIDLKRPLFWLVARPEIKSIVGLKGKVLGFREIGTSPHLAAACLLRKGGSDPEKDITVIGNVDPLQSLVSGAIQATAIGLPSVILARDKFKMNILASAVEECPALDIGIAVREDLLREKRDLIKRMLRALAKARRYFFANEQGSSEVLADSVKVELPVALESYRLARPAFATDGIPTEQEIQEHLKTDAGAMGLSKPVPGDRIFDFSLQREVNRELGIR